MHPERWRHFLIVCGNFHAMGHFLFAGQQSYFDAYTGYFAKLLHKEKCPRLVQDFVNDSFRHMLAFDLELAIGTWLYFISDVTDPNPMLLITDPAAYEAAIQSSGGMVAFKFLEDIGTPVLHWLRSGRDGNGDKVEKLHAHAFHLNRSTTHKVNCVLISLLAIMSTRCVEPEIAAIVKSTVAVSITGRSLQYVDRLLESLNFLQEQRDGKFAAFDRSLHYSDEIEAMLHVAHAWEMMEHGEAASNDPITQAMLNGAATVRRELREKLGTDLTLPTDTNPLWHTGHAVKVSGTNVKGMQPWLFRKHVARGACAGEQRSLRENWQRYVERVIAEQLFPY